MLREDIIGLGNYFQNLVETVEDEYETKVGGLSIKFMEKHIQNNMTHALKLYKMIAENSGICDHSKSELLDFIEEDVQGMRKLLIMKGRGCI